MSGASKRRGLGRGLDALIGEAPAAAAVQSVAVERLHPNRLQPRARFDDAGLDELAESIRTQGVIQPLVVTAREDGEFTIVAGERRWRAAQRAGLTDVPVVVRGLSGDRELLEVALVENLQRADLNPLEEAEAYQALCDRFGLSQEEVAGRVGKARTTVANTLRLLKLPAEVARPAARRAPHRRPGAATARPRRRRGADQARPAGGTRRPHRS